MPNIREIRRRIQSVSNTAKITQAMQMIAASKMRRAQERVLATRPYAEKMGEVLADLASERTSGETAQPLLEIRPAKNATIVLITPNRGLCGGLNSAVFRQAALLMLENQDWNFSTIAVGRKGRDAIIRSGRHVEAEFLSLGDFPSMADTLAISHIIMDTYTKAETDRVFIVYPRFINTAVQQPIAKQILPIEPSSSATGSNTDFLYEPTAEEVLEGLLPRFIEMQIYHALLESLASEQSARMVAMRNATDNANEMADDLTLQYNKVRQEIITTELLDIVGGVNAMEG